jgi:histidinol-phosphatase (PHP family)
MNRPRPFASYHNHTNWSDGKATLMEMIEGARRAGLCEFGISDHYALDPGGREFPWAMSPEFLAEYVDHIQQAKEAEKDLKIRLGLEVDFFPETIGSTKQRLAPYAFDYLIGSVHFINEFPIDLNSQSWGDLSQDSRDRVWRSYWRRLCAVAETGLFDIIGHLDLPKKFGYFPSIDLTEDALAALDAIAAADMAIEINCSGWDKPVREAYPSLFLLKEAKRRNIPLVISSDAHEADTVAGHFDRARQLAADAGYTETARFECRQRFVHRL